MIQYIYFVKCPDCADEPFDFFNDAKDFALGRLSNKPIITQIEVDRNDFGECVDSHDLGMIWSWEDMMSEVPADDPVSVFTHGDFAEYNPEHDDEINALDNSLDNIPDNFHMPVTEESVNKFVIVGEFEDYTKQFYDADTATWVARAEDATLYDDRNDAITVLSDLDTSEFYTTKVMIKPAIATESCSRKAIPEGMTIEQLVEEMEENEDTVECKWCNELFDRSECRKEVDLGYLCPQCIAAIKSRGETLTFTEGLLKEAFNFDELVELYYDSLTTTVCGNQRDVDDWDEEEYTSDYTYMASKGDVATAIWDNFVTEEDVADVPGGLEALEDDAAWEKFLETHFDNLFEKYHAQILEYFKEEAAEDFRERSQEEYQMDQLSSNIDRAYDEWRDERYFGESAQKPFLEEFDDAETHKANLTDCPECGTVSYDMKEQYCSNCGLNL
jgi:hypothetical protein